jgi:hypothetical protein
LCWETELLLLLLLIRAGGDVPMSNIAGRGRYANSALPFGRDTVTDSVTDPTAPSRPTAVDVFHSMSVETFRFGFDVCDPSAGENTQSSVPILPEQSDDAPELVECGCLPRFSCPRAEAPHEVIRITTRCSASAAANSFEFSKVKLSVLHDSQTKFFDENVQRAVQSSDLLPNVYEGGFKLWECSSDLVRSLRFLMSTRLWISV